MEFSAVNRRRPSRETPLGPGAKKDGCFRRLCLVRPQVFPFGKNFAKRQNIKDAVVLGWGRQILEKSSQTMGITAATVNACQRYMENDTRGKFNSSSRYLIMNGVGFFWPNAHT